MEAPTKIIPVELSDGTIVKVEATAIGEQRVASQSRPFSEVTSIIQTVTTDLATSLKHVQRDIAPKKVSVKLGLEIALESGQLTTLIVKGSGKANLELVMEWET